MSFCLIYWNHGWVTTARTVLLELLVLEGFFSLTSGIVFLDVEIFGSTNLQHSTLCILSAMWNSSETIWSCLWTILQRYIQISLPPVLIMSENWEISDYWMICLHLWLSESELVQHNFVGVHKGHSFGWWQVVTQAIFPVRVICFCKGVGTVYSNLSQNIILTM